ncbi:DUF1961 family protein [Daejeonella sp.]|uniref:DUF1961 family protein n=1 Tax=Daejeonella sp. TaxID=2805397 RepID=UPI0030C0FD57
MFDRATFFRALLVLGFGSYAKKSSANILSSQNINEKLIYHNPLATPENIKGFVMEGEALVSFVDNRLQLQNKLDPSQGQKSNFVYWCPMHFPENIAITWDFYPIKQPGLCILFFAAQGKNGEDVMAKSLNRRTGEYGQYHHGDINAYHLSYFRRKDPIEIQLQVCNLRKSYGFHMVSQGADPIPNVGYAKPPYHLKLVKYENQITFYINGLKILHYQDNEELGKVLKGGKIGFRQMAPLVAQYSNLKVFELSEN